jgi:membrane fusion protein, multidrug efflux system
MDQRTDSKRHQEPAEETKHSLRVDALGEHRTLVLVIASLIIVATVAFAIWWVSAGDYVSTDDAFIDARIVSISSQVNAAIVDVPVTDNELVAAGAVLVRLDDRDFKAELDQAVAQADQQQP